MSEGFAIPPQVRPLLVARLRSRLADVAARSGPGPSPGVGAAEDDAALEEALRLCMVRYAARLERGTFREEDLDDYVQQLERINRRPADEDLRFLDALNVGFERLAERGYLETPLCREGFLPAYRQAIENSLRWLEEGAGDER